MKHLHTHLVVKSTFKHRFLICDSLIGIFGVNVLILLEIMNCQVYFRAVKNGCAKSAAPLHTLWTVKRILINTVLLICDSLIGIFGENVLILSETMNRQVYFRAVKNGCAKSAAPLRTLWTVERVLINTVLRVDTM